MRFPWPRLPQGLTLHPTWCKCMNGLALDVMIDCVNLLARSLLLLFRSRAARVVARAFLRQI